MANDFSQDLHCISLYRFESGNLILDSRHGFNLNNVGATSDTTTFREGAGSTLVVATSGQFYYIIDSLLDPTFPLASGTSNKTIGAALWARFPTLPGSGLSYALVSKFETGTGTHRTFRLRARNSGGTTTFTLDLGDTAGNDSQNIVHDAALSTNTWYHLTGGYRDSDKSYVLFVRDTAGETLGTDVTGTATNNIALFPDSDFMIGAFGANGSPQSLDDSWLDECVIEDRLFTATDATRLAKGIYTGNNLFIEDDPLWITCVQN